MDNKSGTNFNQGFDDTIRNSPLEGLKINDMKNDDANLGTNKS